MTLKTRPVRLKLLSRLGAALPGAKVQMQLTVYQTDGPDVVKLVWPLTEEVGSPGFYSGPAWPNTRGDGSSQYLVTADAVVPGQRMQAALMTVVDGPEGTTVKAEMMVNPEPWPPIYAASSEVSAARVFSESAGQSASLANGTKLQVELAAADALAAAPIIAADRALTEAARDATLLYANAVRFTTKAEMELDLAHAAGVLAFVNADNAPGNNGEYIKAGAVGVGSWVRSEDGWFNRIAAVDERTTDLEANPLGGAKIAIVDDEGNAALSVEDDGTVVIPQLRALQVEMEAFTAEEIHFPGTEVSIQENPAPGFAWSVVDALGNVVFGVTDDGRVIGGTDGGGWSTLSVGADDSIVHIGDSYTASHYVVKDKAYISQLSELSPYRHQNFGVSGDDALDMQYRAITGNIGTGLSFADMKARYAFITSLANDQQFTAVDLTFYAENIRRLVETVRAYGTEPVITTEFFTAAPVHAMLRRIAEEYGCGFIDCTTHDAEAGGIDVGPFNQGHPGTRTGGVFWLPMLEFIDRMPKPDRAIKIFRRRSTFAVGAAADLLYTGRVDRARKWKELTVFHYSLNPQNKYDELNQLGAPGFDAQADEYQKLAAKQPVAFADYALIEVTLPGNGVSLEKVELTLNTGGATPTVFVRDFLDAVAAQPGRRNGATPTEPGYLAKWNLPRGAWRSLGAYAAPIMIEAAQLVRSMEGNKLVVMVAGAFSLSDLKVRYKGREQKNDLRVTPQRVPVGPELLLQPLCGTAPQRAGWTLTGAPAVLVPMDVSSAPRKPGAINQVDGVCVLTSADMIGQTVALPSVFDRPRRYLLQVWARYFPKAFLDPSLYPGVDLAQVVDRIANPAAATITPDTCDLRTLKVEVWEGAAYPAGGGGGEFFGFVALQWRPVEFIVEVPPYRTAASLSFRLSCPDGEIQVAKASWKEIA